MTAYAALLRAVNVGANRIAMPALRSVFEQAGCSAVTTYAQSGNVVFTADAPPAALAAELEARIEAAAGFAAPVLLRTAGELAALAAGHPWEPEGLAPAQVVVVFCRAEPPPAGVDALRALAAPGEQVAAAGRELILRLPHGQGRSKLAAAVPRIDLGGPATARNWRTVVKVAEVAATAPAG